MRCTLFFGSALFLCVSLSSSQGGAHDYWDGKNCGPGRQNPSECKVPDWVKQSCCGPSDAHHLTIDMVHGPYEHGTGPEPSSAVSYYMVDGYPHSIPEAKAIPSQDGEYWVFYKDSMYSGVGPGSVYCFFVPFAG